MSGRPSIVVLCGSTRFKELYEEVSVLESAAGKIVLTANINFRDSFHKVLIEEAGYNPGNLKEVMDKLHLRKIDLADEVIVLSQDNYIGESTSREINYARAKGKCIRYINSVTTTSLGRISISTRDSSVANALLNDPEATIEDIRDTRL
jgi:hypothetical protein